MPHRADLPGASLIADGGQGQIKKSGTATVASLSSLPRRGRAAGFLALWHPLPPPMIHSISAQPNTQETSRPGAGAPDALQRAAEMVQRGGVQAPSSPVNGRMEPEPSLHRRKAGKYMRTALPPLPGTQRSPAAAKRVRTNHRTKKSGTATGEHGLPSLSDMKETGGLF